MLIYPVLLCGGSGTRLWPLSRKSYPKQFSSLTGDQSLFQGTALRLSGAGFDVPVIVTGSDFRFIVTEQLDDVGIKPKSILIEPMAKNTAPAILAATLLLSDTDPDGLMLVAPSDHVIPDMARFRQAVMAAVPSAQDGRIVTFGIRPDRAETGFGWLELSDPPEQDFASVPQPLVRFVEKPDATVAAEMLAGGRHLWNAGIFLFSARTLINAFARHDPETLDLVRKAHDGARRDLSFVRLAQQPWSALQDVSIDYSIMEKSDNLTVMPYGGVWSDLGGWEAVWRESGPDANGVVLRGPATAIDCTDSLIRSESDALQLVVIGMKDVIAVAMPDAVLVAHKDRAQDVKKAVAELKKQSAPQAETFPRDHRPWGWFESLVIGSRFQVKRIVVHPGAALSLQSHHHRAEHWIVVQGTARVTIGDSVQLLGENQSVYVPLGAKHRLENPGKVALTLIEVQTGGYLGEDDIVRYEDIYARSNDAAE